LYFLLPVALFAEQAPKMTLGSLSKSNPGTYLCKNYVELLLAVHMVLMMMNFGGHDHSDDAMRRMSLVISGRMSRDSKGGGAASARSFGSASLLDSSGHRCF
jgi:hypothetical protein